MERKSPPVSPLEEFETDVIETLAKVNRPAPRTAVLDRVAQTCNELIRVQRINELSIDLKEALGEPQIMYSVLEKSQAAAHPDHYPDCQEPSTVKGPYVRMYMGPDPISGATAARVAKVFDTEFYSEDPELEHHYVRAVSMEGAFGFFAKLLNDMYGDEHIDLIHSLTMFAVSQVDSRNRADVQKFRTFLNPRFREIPLENKRALITDMLKIYSHNTPNPNDIIGYLFGEDFMQRLTDEGYSEPSQQIERIRELILTKPVLRKKLLAALERLVDEPERVIAGALTRQGFRLLLQEARGISDVEWMRTLTEDMDLKLEDSEWVAEIQANPESAARLDRVRNELATFIETNAQAEPPEMPRLRDIVGCDKISDELQKLSKQYNTTALCALQREAIYRALSAVSRYKAHGKRDERVDKAINFPMGAMQEKRATCFTAPWLMASLLMHCGFKERDLKYCNVQQGYDGQIGGHGSLILNDANDDWLLFDVMLTVSGSSLRALPFIVPGFPEEQLTKVIEDQSDRPVTITVPPKIAESLKIHQHMQVMPLMAGIASGHLLHVGQQFINEDRIKEADYAYSLGLGFCECDPDLWYGKGITAVRKGDLYTAEAHFNQALEHFPAHPWSHFELGNINMAYGKYPEAAHHYKTITKNGAVYRGAEMMAGAQALAGVYEVNPQSMIDIWKGSPYAQRY